MSAAAGLRTQRTAHGTGGSFSLPSGISIADAYLALPEAAAHLGITRRSFWQAIDAMDWQDGLGRRLAPVKPGRDWLIPADRLNAETERRGRAPHLPRCRVCR